MAATGASAPGAPLLWGHYGVALTRQGSGRALIGRAAGCHGDSGLGEVLAGVGGEVLPQRLGLRGATCTAPATLYAPRARPPGAVPARAEPGPSASGAQGGARRG